MNIEFEDIKRHIETAAEWVCNELVTNLDEFAVYELIEKKCRWMTDDTATALVVIHHYGLHGALYGDVDYEDSPQHKFEDDVYRRVEELMYENHGIEIVA